MSEFLNQEIGPYRVLGRLGAGGMGEVYLAEDPRLGRKVALKVIARAADEVTARKRLLREAKAAASIDHPGICTIYEVSEEGPVAFIAMQYIDGESLASRLQRPVSHGEIADIALQLARALGEAHRHGIIHRDIKPQNVMIAAGGRIIVLDFGLARIAVTEEPLSRLTASGNIVGTLSYMSPEQIGGEELDARSDIFSFGIILYEMLCGRTPFDRGSMAATVAAVLFEQPPLEALPVEWRQVLSRTLAKDRQERYPEMSVVVADLERIAVSSAVATFAEPDAPTAAFVKPELPEIASGAQPSVSGGQGRRSVAVLPFMSSDDPEAEYVAEGLSEAAIDALSRVAGLRVMARSTVFRYKGLADPCEFGRTLNVASVLTGDLRTRGERAVLNLELVETATGERQWGTRIDRHSQDLAQLHSSVARAVREAFETPEPVSAEVSKPRDPEAFRQYLIGRHQWNRRIGPATKLAIESFQAAIDLDPTFAPAYVGLADGLAYLGFLEVLSPRETFPRARAAAERALALDPDSAEAITSAAFVRSHHDFDFSAAQELYRRAIEANSNYAVAPHWYGLALTFRGLIDEGEVQLQRARQLDPLNPIMNVATAFPHYYRRDYRRAIAIYRNLVELEPHFMPLRNYFGNTLALTGQAPEALDQFEAVRGTAGESTVLLASIGFALARGGRPDDARAILNDLEEQRPSRYSSSFAPAVIYAGLGESEHAFHWLDRALEDRSPWLISVGGDPRFDELRGDSRFDHFLERVGYWK